MLDAEKYSSFNADGVQRDVNDIRRIQTYTTYTVQERTANSFDD